MSARGAHSRGSRWRASLLSFCALLVLAGCASAARRTTAPAGGIAASPTPTHAPSPLPTASASPTEPAQYTSRIVYQGSAHPDDLALDAQGRLLFSDVDGGTVNRVNVDGSVTVLASGLAGPEGMVPLPDGTLVVAEQRTNRVLALAPGTSTPTVLRALPGVPSAAACKDGVDNIALDPTANTLIVPDSPTGNVYRLSLDGHSLTLLASGMARPVGAAVDALGNVYVADECGGAVWRIAPSGAATTLGGFGAPDDVAIDPQGNLLVIDLASAIHALIRVELSTGRRQVLASDGLLEPQGLVVDGRGDVYVADEASQRIIGLIPR